MAWNNNLHLSAYKLWPAGERAGTRTNPSCCSELPVAQRPWPPIRTPSTIARSYSSSRHLPHHRCTSTMPIAHTPHNDLVRTHTHGADAIFEETDWLAAALREDEASGYTTPEEFEAAEARTAVEDTCRVSLVPWRRLRGYVLPMGVGVRNPSRCPAARSSIARLAGHAKGGRYVERRYPLIRFPTIRILAHHIFDLANTELATISHERTAGGRVFFPTHFLEKLARHKSRILTQPTAGKPYRPHPPGLLPEYHKIPDEIRPGVCTFVPLEYPRERPTKDFGVIQGCGRRGEGAGPAWLHGGEGGRAGGDATAVLRDGGMEAAVGVTVFRHRLYVKSRRVCEYDLVCSSACIMPILSKPL